MNQRHDVVTLKHVRVEILFRNKAIKKEEIGLKSSFVYFFVNEFPVILIFIPKDKEFVKLFEDKNVALIGYNSVITRMEEIK